MNVYRIRLRALAAGLLIAAVILGGLRAVQAQEGSPGASPPTTSQIAEMIQGQDSGLAAAEPAALDAGGQAAIIAAELLLVPEEFFVNLPLITR